MPKRWKYRIVYTTGPAMTYETNGEVEELSELQDIVEGGPDHTTLKDLHVTYNLGKEDANAGQ